jgi:hypothetical protein
MSLTVQRLNEQITVLRHFECADGRTQDFDAQSLQHSHLVELDTDVESRLTTKREEDAIGTFLLEDVGDVVGRDREEVDLAGEMVGSLDGSNVWVDEDRLNVGFSKSLDGLRA